MTKKFKTAEELKDKHRFDKESGKLSWHYRQGVVINSDSINDLKDYVCDIAEKKIKPENILSYKNVNVSAENVKVLKEYVHEINDFLSGESLELSSWITDIIYEIESDYQSFYDLGADDWSKVHGGSLSFLEELREEAQELIDGGDSHEKREGYGMMKVIDAIRSMPTNLYFELIAIGKNEDLGREEIQIHAGENGNIMIVKTDEGFVIDVYGQNDLVDTMAIWEDTLNPLDDDEESGDPRNFSIVEQEDFLDEYGQLTDEVCAALGYDPETSDDLLMVDYFYYEPKKYWIPIISSSYSEREQAIADYLRLG